VETFAFGVESELFAEHCWVYRQHNGSTSFIVNAYRSSRPVSSVSVLALRTLRELL
jgi:hypothetical protein